MKKILFLFLLTILTISVYAQSSFDLRFGAGFGSARYWHYNSYKSYDYGNDKNFGIILQPNIALNSNNKWYISPSLNGFFTQIEDVRTIISNLNMLFGYRIEMGNKNFFFPKVGTFAGLECQKGEIPGSMLAGVSGDMAFEFKHFVFGVDGFYSFKKLSYLGNPYGAHLTIGFKIGRISSSGSGRYYSGADKAWSYNTKANDYFSRGAYRKAASYYSKAFWKKPQGQGGTEIFNEGVSLYNMGKYKKAIQNFELCLTYRDLTDDARQRVDGLIDDATRLQNEKEERRLAIWGAVLTGLAQSAQNMSPSYGVVSGRPSYNTPYSSRYSSPTAMTFDQFVKARNASRTRYQNLFDQRFDLNEVMRRTFEQMNIEEKRYIEQTKSMFRQYRGREMTDDEVNQAVIGWYDARNRAFQEIYNTSSSSSSTSSSSSSISSSSRKSRDCPFCFDGSCSARSEHQAMAEIKMFCNGTGECQWCNKGWDTEHNRSCSFCNGTGKCPTCKGNKKCVHCKGAATL